LSKALASSFLSPNDSHSISRPQLFLLQTAVFHFKFFPWWDRHLAKPFLWNLPLSWVRQEWLTYRFIETESLPTFSLIDFRRIFW
jgi:hypothetical protein